MANLVSRRLLVVVGVLVTGAAAMVYMTDAVTPAYAQPPCISDPGGPYTGTVNQGIQFDASASVIDWDGCCVNFNWNFGDLTSTNSGAPTHAYSAPGTYTVRLRLTHSYYPGMCSATTTATITY